MNYESFIYIGRWQSPTLPVDKVYSPPVPSPKRIVHLVRKIVVTNRLLFFSHGRIAISSLIQQCINVSLQHCPARRPDQSRLDVALTGEQREMRYRIDSKKLY